jgi:hypothetical protein
MDLPETEAKGGKERIGNEIRIGRMGKVGR